MAVLISVELHYRKSYIQIALLKRKYKIRAPDPVENGKRPNLDLETNGNGKQESGNRKK
ncbi:MAG: hypothetical protein K9N00_00440 [Candidatus Marinimicrobia bacterium]|nr:hypothetical protein [Candidatus Neomarinimicrobiota bacterium]